MRTNTQTCICTTHARVHTHTHNPRRRQKSRQSGKIRKQNSEHKRQKADDALVVAFGHSTLSSVMLAGEGQPDQLTRSLTTVRAPLSTLPYSLPYPTLPYPTLPYPTLPYPTLLYPT